MRLERTFSVPISADTAHERVIAHMTRMGYRLVESGSTLTFQRGAPWSSLVSFTPKGWGVKARIDVSPAEDGAQVSALFDITTIGQMVTQSERAYWDGEIASLIAAMGGDPSGQGVFIHSDQPAVLQNVVIFFAASAAAGIFGAGGSFILGQLFDTWVAGAVGGCGGVVLGVVLGTWAAARWLPPLFK